MKQYKGKMEYGVYHGSSSDENRTFVGWGDKEFLFENMRNGMAIESAFHSSEEDATIVYLVKEVAL